MYGLSDRHFSLQNYSSVLSRTSLSYASDAISELFLKFVSVHQWIRRLFSSPPPPNDLPLFLTIQFKGLRFVSFVFCALTLTEPDYESAK